MEAQAAAPLIRVRAARPGDLARIQAIYAHHVMHGLSSFEQTPPGLEEMTRRFEATRAEGLPYLAAVLEGPGRPAAVQGYAYAGRYRARPAYRYTVENSVYVAPESMGRGLGRALMGELIRRCTELGFRQMVAVIGDSGNLDSIRFHESFGFAPVGSLRAVGFKFGRWVDSVIMQRPLGEGAASLPARPPASRRR